MAASDKIGPKELAQRMLRDRTYAGKNERAAKAATIDNLKDAMAKTSAAMVKAKPKPAKKKSRRFKS